MNVSQIRNALEDLLSDSDNGGVSDDSVADTSYFPQTLQESSDDSDDGDDGDNAEDGGDVRELPDIPEDIPMDVEAVPGPSHGGGGDRASSPGSPVQPAFKEEESHWKEVMIRENV